LVEHVFEFSALALVARRVHVRDVVRNDIDVHLLSLHAAGGDGEGAHRDGSLCLAERLNRSLPQ